MEAKIFKKNDEEARIQERVVQKLTLRGWYCIKTHGNAYQSGFPDLYACHKRYGFRWIEIKKPKGSRFTQAQLNVFTKLSGKNVNIYVITHENQVDNIHGQSNWYSFLEKSRGIILETEIKRIVRTGPEAIIQSSIISELATQGWFCIETFGSLYQFGFPDIFACHAKYGCRWIECKNPLAYSFTPAQIDVFPRFTAEGIGIWILTNASEIPRLFEASNWKSFL